MSSSYASPADLATLQVSVHELRSRIGLVGVVNLRQVVQEQEFERVGRISASCRTCSSGPASCARGPVVEILDELRPTGAGEPDAESMIAPHAGIVTLEESERIHIRQALAASGGRIHGPDGAAALLAVNPSTLGSRMKKLGIMKKSA